VSPVGNWVLAVDLGGEPVAAAVAHGSVVEILEFRKPLGPDPGSVLAAACAGASSGRDPAIPSQVIVVVPAGVSGRALVAIGAVAASAGLPVPGYAARPAAIAGQIAPHLAYGSFAGLIDLGPHGAEVAVLRRTPAGFELAAPPGVLERPPGELPDVSVRRTVNQFLTTTSDAGLPPGYLTAVYVTAGRGCPAEIADLLQRVHGIPAFVVPDAEVAAVRGALDLLARQAPGEGRTDLLSGPWVWVLFTAIMAVAIIAVVLSAVTWSRLWRPAALLSTICSRTATSCNL